MTSERKSEDWTDTAGKQSPSQPGPTNENPNEKADGRGDAPAPSTGNQQGGETPGDTSGAPTGPSGPTGGNA